jgi:hypothetical protein
MIKYLDFNVQEPDRTGERTDLTWDTFQLYRNEVRISKRFNDYVKGKSIIIVGPSPYLQGKGRGEFIDSHDIVIRLNRGWNIPKDIQKDYGSKTNVRWHCMMEHHNNGGPYAITEMLDYGVEWLVSQFPRNLDYFHYDILKFEEQNQDRINFHYSSDLIYFLNIHRALETRPNVAQSAIFDLINYDYKSLHLSGVTFLLDGYYNKYSEPGFERKHRGFNVAGHKAIPQIHLTKLIHDNIDNFSMDKEIIDLVYKVKY